MKTLRSRLRRHLTYANVIASIAVFLAFGGVGYAATTLNGKRIVNHSIGAGKLKNGTLTSAQVKKNSLTGAVIEEASLGAVPQAQNAVSATTAESANSAASAETAGYATNADHAVSADTAASASTAEDADTVDGLTASQLQVSCPADTELFGGMCWDEDARTAHGWVVASVECGEEGGRLPSLSELVAYVLRPGEQVSGPTWSSDVIDVSGGDPVIATRDEGTTASSPASSGSFGYRCLFYRVN